MPAIQTERETLLLEWAGYQYEMPLQIAYVVDPGSSGALDEPPCDAFVEILSVREVIDGTCVNDIMDMLPSKMIEDMQRYIADKLEINKPFRTAA